MNIYYLFQAKVKPLNASNSANTSLLGAANKSTIFDGLEEDENNANDKEGLFVPRSSVKKLVLKPKSHATSNISSGHVDVTLSAVDTTVSTPDKTGDTTSPTAAVPSSNPAAGETMDESLNFPSVKKLPTKVVNVEVHDESFSNLNTKRKDFDDSIDKGNLRNVRGK